MSDELEPQALEAEDYFAEEATPEPEPAPEPAPEPEPVVADDFAEREAALKKRERELNAWNMKIAEREKALVGSGQEKPAEPLGQLDDEAAKVLDAFIQSKYGDKFQLIDTFYNNAVQETVETFAAQKGVEPEELFSTLQESGVQPADYTPKGLKTALEAAYAIKERKAFDPEAERAKLRAEILAEMNERGLATAEPVGRVDLEGGPDIDSDELSPAEKYARIIAKMK